MNVPYTNKLLKKKKDIKFPLSSWYSVSKFNWDAGLEHEAFSFLSMIHISKQGK